MAISKNADGNFENPTPYDERLAAALAEFDEVDFEYDDNEEEMRAHRERWGAHGRDADIVGEHSLKSPLQRSLETDPAVQELVRGWDKNRHTGTLHDLNDEFEDHDRYPPTVRTPRSAGSLMSRVNPPRMPRAVTTLVSRVSDNPRTRRCVLIALVCSVVLVISCSISLSMTRSRIASPSIKSLEGIVDDARYEQLAQALKTISPYEKFLDTSTPQFRALRWLTDADGMQLGVDSPNLEQRYVLATFFFSTNGDQWSRNNYWMTSSRECEWQYVDCNYQVQGSPEPQVTALKLYTNNLRGHIPDELMTLTFLRVLDLSENGLQGQLPSNLGSLKDLVDLRLQENNFSGALPLSLFTCDQLQFLNLSNNQFVGSIPNEFGNLYNLREVFLEKNFFQGQLPSSIGNLVRLEHLYLDTNKLTGRIPPSIAFLVNLKELGLHSNRFSGYIPDALQKCVLLQDLYWITTRLWVQFLIGLEIWVI